MQKIKQKELQKRGEDILFYLAIVLPIFCGIGNIATTIVSVLELLILLYYIKSSKFWMLSPIFYIYYSQLKISTAVFFNVYIFLALFKLVFFSRFNIKNKVIIGLFVIVAYAGLVLMSNIGIWTGVLFLIQSVVSLLSLIQIKSNNEIHKGFKEVLVAICVSAMLYGIIFQNIKGTYSEADGLIKYSGRYSGTKADPNYMSFYYCLSLVVVLFREYKHNIFKWILASIFFVAIAISGSVTAFFIYAITLILYILLAQEKRFYQKLFGVCLIVAAVIFFVYYIKNDLTNLSFLNLLKGRLLEKIKFWLADDLDAFTTGRTEYSKLYLEFFFKQNVFRILFGGYQINSMGLVGEAANAIRYASHNSYVDVIMTAGLIGLVAFITLLLCNLRGKIKKYLQDKNAENISNIIMSLVSIVFIFSISAVPGVEYMFFLFV